MDALLFIIGVFCSIFGIVRTIWERKLILSRKIVTGTDGFTSTIFGSLFGAAGLYQLTHSYIYAFLYLGAWIAAYAVTCAVVKKEEYPPEDHFTKE